MHVIDEHSSYRRTLVSSLLFEWFHKLMANTTLIIMTLRSMLAGMVIVLVLGRAVGAAEPPPTNSVNVEAQALMDFKKGITSDPLGRLISWDVMINSSAGAGHPCAAAWSGIACDAQKQHVISINLASSNLSGSISPSLALLPALSNLNLSDNFLSGGLPSSLFNRPSSALQHLNLSYNMLSGSLPDYFANLSALLTLDLSSNFFLGEIPLSLGQCQGLERLYLIETGLTGRIPAQIWQLPALIALQIFGDLVLEAVLPEKFASCPTIKVLALSNVNATRSAFPSSLVDCLQLQVLFLNVIGLEGFIPPEVWQLPLLRILVVEDAQVSTSIDDNADADVKFKLHGSLPSSFRCCPTITMLAIDGVNLTGEIPPALGQCTALQHLDLSHGSLQGVIPQTLGNLSNLQRLYIEANKLTGTIPKMLFQSSGLLELRLGYNKNLTGAIPRELGKLKHLQVLSLYSTHLQSPMPEELCNCTELVWLDLGWATSPDGVGKLPNCVANLAQLQTLAWQFNAMNGEVPMKVLQNLTQLVYLDMSYTSLVGRLPPELGNLSNLQTLGFRGNYLTGPIPLELSHITGLQQLDLTRNRLNGSLSEQFFLSLASGSSIERLFFSINELQGVIPNSIGGLQKLQAFYIDQNQIEGRIPYSLGNCTALQDLVLASNRLHGEIPATLGLLTGLNENLLLSSNQLSGEIPIELGALAQLKHLDLSTNNLTGDVPIKSFENCSNLQTLRLYQNSLTGRIEQFDLSLKLQHLETFTVHQNNFIGGLPSGFPSSKELVLLDVQRSNLSGRLPFNGAVISGLQKLRVLVMSYNELSGEIPGWVWHLPMLQVLDLSNNRFGGTLPATVTHLDYFKHDQSRNSNQATLYEEVPQTIKATFQVLSYILNTRIFFDVSMNCLEGEIAVSFGELLGLTGLNLSHNYIHGEIPKSLGNLVHLDELDLSHNNLTGNIPQELGLVGGGVLDLSYNQLCGPIPTLDNFNTRYNYTSFEGNPDLCGYPLLVNCSTPNKPMTHTLVGDSHAWSFIACIESFASPWALLITYPIGFLGGLYFLNRIRRP